MDTWPEHNHVLQRHFSTNKFPINAFSMLFSHPCHQELAKKEASTHHMNMATENRRLALLLPSNLYTAYSSAVLHSFLITFSASSMWRSYSLQGGMKPNGGEFAVYSWCAFLHASGSLRKTAECSSQILKYRYRSWDDLVIIACSATVNFFGMTTGNSQCHVVTGLGIRDICWHFGTLEIENPFKFQYVFVTVIVI